VIPGPTRPTRPCGRNPASAKPSQHKPHKAQTAPNERSLKPIRSLGHTLAEIENKKIEANLHTNSSQSPFSVKHCQSTTERSAELSGAERRDWKQGKQKNVRQLPVVPGPTRPTRQCAGNPASANPSKHEPHQTQNLQLRTRISAQIERSLKPIRSLGHTPAEIENKKTMANLCPN